jgi:hypothetical protein
MVVAVVATLAPDVGVVVDATDAAGVISGADVGAVDVGGLVDVVGVVS